MRNISVTPAEIFSFLITANFYFSMTLLIIGCGVSVSDQYQFFEFNVEIYGEMANNLRLMMAYLAFTELMLFGFCYLTGQYQFYLLVGLFLMTMVGSLEIYGAANAIEIDPSMDIFFLYTGLSHFLFGVMHAKANYDRTAQKSK